MRQISKKEAAIVEFLANAAGVSLPLNNNQAVWVVNPQMKSIRADYCPNGCQVFSLVSRQFNDSDGVPVIATLLLTADQKFGELDFWKVDDTPLLHLPKSVTDLRKC